MASELVIYVDGACRGNPGPAAAGVVIRSPGGKVHRYGFYLGPATNNIAEYTALIKALAWVHGHGTGEKVRVYSDSQLLVRQVMGEYRVRDAALKTLWKTVMASLEQIPSWEFHHVPREENKEADRMANRALDAEGDVRD